MALHNAQGMYNESAALNPLPYVNIALQARQRKQAREDAIDKYYQKLPDTINDKGVRDIEIPIINDYRDKIFDYGLKNKEALRNPKLDRGAAQHNFNKLINEARGVARLSQDAAKDDLEIGKIRIQKGNEWMVDDDEFMADNERHNLPVTDPNFKKIDVNKVLQGRPFDLNKKIKNYADIKMGEGTPEITPHPTDPLLEVVKTKPVFDEATKQTLYTRAVNDYHNDRKFQKELEKLTPPEISELNEISKSAFGHPLREDFAGEDMAAAFIARALAPKPTTQKVVPNKDAIMDRQLKERQDAADLAYERRKKMAALNFGYKTAYKDYTAGVDAATDEKVLNTFIKNTYDSGNKESITATVGGNKFTGRVVDLPKDIKDKYVVDKGYSSEQIPSAWLLTDDKQKIVPLFYGEKNQSGGYQLKANPNSKPIDIQNFKVDLGKLLLTQKKRGGEVIDQFEEETPATTPKVKTTTKSGLPVFHK